MYILTTIIKMFPFFNKKNLINIDELLLDIFKEKGVVQIINGYKEDLEDIQEKIDYDIFQI